jgi:hypothetical protein
MSTKQQILRLQVLAEQRSAEKADPTRHKYFVSYHVADIDEVAVFLGDYSPEFIPRSVGATEEDDFVNSTDDEYIKRRIREKYLTDSTVTIVLLGTCTWSRKFVDWEISSSLRNDSVNRRSGLLAIPLPSRNNTATLPARVGDNWVQGDRASSYAAYESYPSSGQQLRTAIETAFAARTAKADKVDNSRALRKANSAC